MATTTRMSAQDALWLTMDRPNSLMVIDSVMWFREVPDWDTVETVVAGRLVERYPVFSQRPRRDERGWAWQDDPGFRLDRHVQRVSLPPPGDMPALQRFVAGQRSVPLDKTRPLWALFLIDGLMLPDGTAGAAVLSRFHHAIADGVRLVQVALSLCDPAEGQAPVHVGRRLRRSTTPASVAVSAARQLGRSAVDVALTTAESAEDALAAAVDTTYTALAGDPVAALGRLAGGSRQALRAGSSVLRRPERVGDVAGVLSTPGNRVVNDVASVGKLALSGRTPRTIWSGTPGVRKGAYLAPPIALEQVKQVRRASGTTVNDVLVAAVSGALTRYLRGHGEHDLDEVMWMVPVSVKPVDAEQPPELGNHFALVALRMPLQVDDPRRLLAEVHQRMQRIKHSDEPLVTYGIQRGIARAPGPVATSLTNYFANKAVGVLTNVPGPGQPVALAGTEVEGILGWAPCSGDQAMTVCIFTYDGRVTVGFGTDEALVPDGQMLAGLFAEEFARMHRTIVGRVP